MISLFTYLYNGISQGYPFVEAIVSLLPLADELVIADAGSDDGTREWLAKIDNGNTIRVYDVDKWTDGLGGRNHLRTASMCHDLCRGDLILMTEGDEVWQESLVEATWQEINSNGSQYLTFWRYQLSFNFNRCFWYPEPGQHVERVFPRGSEVMRGDRDVMARSDKFRTQVVSNDHGYIVDCRNNFRDCYLVREDTSEKVWGESKPYIRRPPIHASYKWDIPRDEFVSTDLNDDIWTWKHTIFDIPDILRYHLGKPKYEIRAELLFKIHSWSQSVK